MFATGGVVRSGGSPKHDEIPFPIGCDYVVRPKCPMCAGGNTATYPTTGAAAAHAEYLTQMIGAALWVAQECPAGKWHIMQVAP